ncbi:hypothetical protein BT96DRAFT_1008469 [Gymnopus androsaceus JB14]|uniref:Uncharacterized protein n=1 Tax=Gymnopus androsaceus JB14 TaxID=1447944 RepID=A0A6A4GF31_9AGAR|nr:hypothetical protein BT96DRAFT_1008469 [Gymnopus androsaceus JB14]
MSERESELSMSLSGFDDDDEEKEANGNNFACDFSRRSTSSSVKAAGQWRTEIGTGTSESSSAGCTGYGGSLTFSPTTPSCSLASQLQHNQATYNLPLACGTGSALS